MSDTNKDPSSSIEIRHLNLSDFKELLQSMEETYPRWTNVSWTEDQVRLLIEKFPEGQFVALVDGKVVGSALSIIVDYNQFGDDHTYEMITANDTFDTHDPRGNTLYGIDVFVHHNYRGMRMGRRLYDARKALCEKFNLKSIVFSGRIPRYAAYEDKISAEEYIEKVRNKELLDPTLNFQLSNDFYIKKIIRQYMPGEKEAEQYGILLQWDNIYYQKPIIQDQKSHISDYGTVRIALVQWQMRLITKIEGLLEQFEYFVEAVSQRNADFVVFPENFSAPLMSNFNEMPEPMAIRKLAKFTEQLKEEISKLAIKYYINIVAGSMPLVVNEQLHNVGYLCHRDGRIDRYEKLHITPNEVQSWGLKGGNSLQTFETDCGKVGVLICYDVEFPELARKMSDEGMQILFVPFNTVTQNAYNRVRNCAQARAIENECYVAIAGSVGNMPVIHNMGIQYAQSAIFTPSDFSFPANGIKAESTPNTEMILLADLDLDLLKQLHNYGSVRNLRDRRKDLYKIEFRE